ncbi:YhjD/YihY/BrkB family envelope integrity protein [Microbacterium sp. GXF7504]
MSAADARDRPGTAATPGLIARATAWALERKLVRAFLLYSDHRGPSLADGITYRTLFSVFAGVLLGFSIAALWLAGNPDAWQALVGAVEAAVPGIGDIVDFDDIHPVGLSFAGIVSLVGLVGAAIGAIGSLRVALRTLSGQLHDDTFFVWVLLRNLLLALLIGGLLAASAAATVVGTASVDALLGWLGLTTLSWLAQAATTTVTLVVTFALDVAAILLAFRLLSGVRAPARALWPGALLGGVGLTVLQALSGLFVGGAASNPLLATFASLIALLLWLNLSAQVILIAAAYIITGVEDAADRVHARHGAATMTQRRVRRAEIAVQAATDELRAAREAEAEERAG